MQDVATRAGVSQATVSFVLNGVATARVSEQTRQRVVKAARTLGYKRSKRTRSDARLGSMIAMIIDEVDASPFAAPFIAGAREAAWEHQSLVATVTTRSHEPMERATIEAVLGVPVIGIIYGSLLTREISLPNFGADIPVVLLNCYEAENRYCSVLLDDLSGARAVTSALIADGHTAIGYLAGEDWLDAGRDRLLGYYSALQEAGLPVHPQYIQRLGSSFEGAIEGTRALLALSTPPTAIACFNDRMAVGALQVAREMNVRVPHDLSIVGFDNDSFSSKLFPSGLTTVELPHENMARTAVQRIFQLRKKKLKPTQTLLPCPIVKRGSISSLESAAKE